MKFFFFFSFFFIFLATASFGQTPTCSKFKDGKFKIAATSYSKEMYINRKGDKQKESVEGEEGFTEYIVKWIDNCTYTLTPTAKTYLKFPKLPENAVLTVKIIEVKDHSYIQTSTANFADYAATSEVIKIK